VNISGHAEDISSHAKNMSNHVKNMSANYKEYFLKIKKETCHKNELLCQEMSSDM
jgi:hypothetical protein